LKAGLRYADIIRMVAYFVMDVLNKPGEGALALGALANEVVNLLGFTGFSPVEGRCSLILSSRIWSSLRMPSRLRK
jgi:hypothetical protein